MNTPSAQQTTSTLAQALAARRLRLAWLPPIGIGLLQLYFWEKIGPIPGFSSASLSYWRHSAAGCGAASAPRLRNSEQRFRLVADNSPSAIMIWDKPGKVRYISPTSVTLPRLLPAGAAESRWEPSQ